MGVQDAIALLNGNEASSFAAKRPPITSNWTAKRTNAAVKSADKKTDNASNSIKTPSDSTIPIATTTTATNTTTTTRTRTTPAPVPVPAPVGASTTSRCQQKSRTTINTLVEELTAQYQEALEKNDSSKQLIAKLESDVERYACDSTKVRDYEIRVEYLAQKLEQVSEERDLLEQELSSYKDRHGILITPVSPAFGPDVFGGGKPPPTTMIEAVAPTAVAAVTAAAATTPKTHQNIGTNQQHNETISNNEINGNNNDTTNEKMHQQQQQQLEDIYFDEILDAYEERRSEDNDGNMMMMQEHNEQMMAQMLAEYDQGMKMAMEVYVADLEKQRLENKTLQSMVKKQDELIKKLESQSGDYIHQLSDSGNDNHSNKQERGQQLLVLHQQQQQEQHQLRAASPSFRSSIDVLAEMARDDSVHGIDSLLHHHHHHHHHHQRDTGRNTPPPFAPPKTPLPPLPATGDHSNTSINNDSLISYSRSSTSSTTWSSDEHQQQQQQHPLSTMTTELPPKHDSSIDDHHTGLAAPADSSASSGSFWNGLKKSFN